MKFSKKRKRNNGTLLIPLEKRVEYLTETCDTGFGYYFNSNTHLLTQNERACLNINPSYMDKTQTKLTWTMRSILIDWLGELQTEFKLGDDTLFSAFHFIDRYLSKKQIRIDQAQSVGMAALYIASKVYDLVPIHIEDFTYITDNCNTKQLVKIEKDMLLTLDFNAFDGNPFDFLLPWCQILMTQPIPNTNILKEVTNGKRKIERKLAFEYDESKAKNFEFLCRFQLSIASASNCYVKYKTSELVACSMYLTAMYLSTISNDDIIIDAVNIKETDTIENTYSHPKNEKTKGKANGKANGNGILQLSTKYESLLTSKFNEIYTITGYSIHSKIIIECMFKLNKLAIEFCNKKSINITPNLYTKFTAESIKDHCNCKDINDLKTNQFLSQRFSIYSKNIANQ